MTTATTYEDDALVAAKLERFDSVLRLRGARLYCSPDLFNAVIRATQPGIGGRSIPAGVRVVWMQHLPARTIVAMAPTQGISVTLKEGEGR